MKTYTFKKQLDNRGCYAEIIFDVQIVNPLSNNIKIKYLADPKWEEICKAGILIFYDYFVRKMSGDMEVCIHEIRWLPIDTNNIIILFATVEALKEALGLQIDGFLFETKNESFIFPEVRSNSLLSHV